jgi:hypothetical protein
MGRPSQSKRAAEGCAPASLKKPNNDATEVGATTTSSIAPQTAGAIVTGFSDGESESGARAGAANRSGIGARIAGSGGFILAAHEELVCTPCGANSKDRLQLFIIS